MKNFFKSWGIFSSKPAGPELKNKPPAYLSSRIIPIEIPLPYDEEVNWKPHFLFKGHLRNVNLLSCHVSVLKPGYCPHPPHTHAHEEILILLSGEVDLVLPDDDSLQGEKRRRLKKGEFVYYPTGFPHTLETVSKEPANYLMFKWTEVSENKMPHLPFRHFQNILSDDGFDLTKQFAIKGLFTGSTAWLKRFHGHVTRLSPGGGYDPHADDHDVAIIMLEGEVETLGERVKPYGVIFYAAGEVHGMQNPGLVPASYLVFSFDRNVKVPGAKNKAG